MKSFLCLITLAGALSAPAFADITISHAWVRATVPQQRATGAFMRIDSTNDVKLVAVESPVARIVEIHEMKMDNNIMKMRQVPGIDVARKSGLELKPGGYHVMLIDLKEQVREGDSIPVTLVFESPDLKREKVTIQAIGRPLNSPGSAPPMAHGH